MSRPGISGVGLDMGGGVGGFGVLDFWGLDWNSILDHGNVLSVVVSGVDQVVPSAVPLSIIPAAVPSSIPVSSTALGLSNSSKVGSLSGSDFGGVKRDSVHDSMALGLSVGGKVDSLSLSDFSGVDDTAIGSKRSMGVEGGVGSGDDGVLARKGTSMGSVVFSFGSLDFRGVDGGSVVADPGGGVSMD